MAPPNIKDISALPQPTEAYPNGNDDSIRSDSSVPMSKSSIPPPPTTPPKKYLPAIAKSEASTATAFTRSSSVASESVDLSNDIVPSVLEASPNPIEKSPRESTPLRSVLVTRKPPLPVPPIPLLPVPPIPPPPPNADLSIISPLPPRVLDIGSPDRPPTPPPPPPPTALSTPPPPPPPPEGEHVTGTAGPSLREFVYQVPPSPQLPNGEPKPHPLPVLLNGESQESQVKLWNPAPIKSTVTSLINNQPPPSVLKIRGGKPFTKPRSSTPPVLRLTAEDILPLPKSATSDQASSNRQSKRVSFADPPPSSTPNPVEERRLSKKQRLNLEHSIHARRQANIFRNEAEIERRNFASRRTQLLKYMQKIIPLGTELIDRLMEGAVSQLEQQEELQGERQEELQEESQGELQREPQREPQMEPQREPQREPPKELQREPPKVLQKEPPKELQKEPPKELQREPPKDLQREPPKDLQREPPKELQREPPKELQREPPKELQREPPKELQKELPREPQNQPPIEPPIEPPVEPPPPPPMEPPRVSPKKVHDELLKTWEDFTNLAGLMMKEQLPRLQDVEEKLLIIESSLLSLDIRIREKEERTLGQARASHGESGEDNADSYSDDESGESVSQHTASSSSKDASIVRDYYDKIGEVRLTKDYIHNLDTEHKQKVNHRKSRREMGGQPSIPDDKFYQEYFDERHDLIHYYATTKHAVQILFRMCQENGHEVELPDLPPQDPDMDLSYRPGAGGWILYNMGPPSMDDIKSFASIIPPNNTDPVIPSKTKVADWMKAVEKSMQSLQPNSECSYDLAGSTKSGPVEWDIYDYESGEDDHASSVRSFSQPPPAEPAHSSRTNFGYDRPSKHFSDPNLRLTFLDDSVKMRRRLVRTRRAFSLAE